MFRSLVGLLGWSSERVAPSRRAALGVESLDGRVMPSAMIADPPRIGEEIPTLTRLGSTEEIPQSHRGDVSVSGRRGSTEEIPQLVGAPQEHVNLNPSPNCGEEIPQWPSAQEQVSLNASRSKGEEIPTF